MADLSALEELLLGSNGLGSLDTSLSLLLAGAQAQTAAAEPGLGLGAFGLDALPQQLPQQSLNPWAGTDQGTFYQEVAQSLAARLEEQRLQQAQTAAVLQHFQALQQQQQLAQLQQQVSMLHEQSPREAQPFRRSRTTDLESIGQVSSFDMAGAYSAALELDQRQLSMLQTVNPTPRLSGFPRSSGVVSQHSLPVRSFSSEHLMARQQRVAQMQGAAVPLPSQTTGRRPPVRQPSGLGPNGRGNQNRPADGGRRARYAATAKAPSWASEDWHPMKAVIASGARATGGTGVFLPHLAGPPSGATTAASDAVESGISAEVSPVADAAAAAAGPAVFATAADAAATGGDEYKTGAGPSVSAAAATVSAAVSLSPPSPTRGASPTGSADSNVVGSVDTYSCQTTQEFSRTSTRSELLDTHSLSTMGHIADMMKVVAEEPEREREEECDFSSLARELAELMNKQVDV